MLSKNIRMKKRKNSVGEKNMLEMNLQCFAEDSESEVEITTTPEQESSTEEVVEENSTEEEKTEEDTVETAETSDDKSTDGTDDVEEKKKRQSAEANRIAAAARRASQEELRKRDQRIAEKYGNLVNPITKQPIRSEQDYFDALDAQERLESEKQLQQKGINPQILSNYLKGMPEMKAIQAMQERIEQETKERNFKEGLSYLEKEIKAIQELDPSIKTKEDLDTMDGRDEIVALCNKGVTLAKAFKAVNSDLILARKTKEIKQATINQAKGKSHLQQLGGENGTTGDINVSAELMESLRLAFPNVSDSDLKKKVKEVL